MTAWKITIDATFEAEDAEDAEAISQRLIAGIVEHPAVLEGEASCEETTQP